MEETRSDNQITESTAEQRDRDPITGRFLEGNPGRPKGVRNFTTKVREALEKIADGKDYTYEEAFIKSILKKAIVDHDSTIIKLIWNYLDGMPAQDITTGGEKLPTPIINVLSHDSNQQDNETEKEDQGSSGGNISE